MNVLVTAWPKEASSAGQNLLNVCTHVGGRRPTIYAAEGPVGELAREALDHAYWPTPLLGSAMQVLLACKLLAPIAAQ